MDKVVKDNSNNIHSKNYNKCMHNSNNHKVNSNSNKVMLNKIMTLQQISNLKYTNFLQEILHKVGSIIITNKTSRVIKQHPHNKCNKLQVFQVKHNHLNLTVTKFSQVLIKHQDLIKLKLEMFIIQFQNYKEIIVVTTLVKEEQILVKHKD